MDRMGDTNTKHLLSNMESKSIIIIINDLLSILESRKLIDDGNGLAIYFPILKVILSDHGFTMTKHIFQYQAFTETELSETYRIPFGSVHKFVTKLVKAGIVKAVSKVGSPYDQGKGKRAKLYLLTGMAPEKVHEAQRRFGEIKQSKRRDTVNQTQLEEAFNLVKTYMGERETNHVPERQIIKMILKENEIKGVEIPLLVNRLRKEGCRW